ncbi:MAG TPA: hypothetical protein VGA64_01770, partial [Candidatus Polarisedimenticolia bacterium]
MRERRARPADSPERSGPTLRRLDLAALLAWLALATACSGGPSVRYQVGIAPGHPDRIEVRMDLDGVPRSGLTLKGFATKEVLRITQV